MMESPLLNLEPDSIDCVNPGNSHSLESTDTPRSSASGSRTSISRVCDRCIRKKIKCDTQRPTCSRCSEHGHTCVYSYTRRRPGPARGFRRSRRSPKETLNHPDHDHQRPSVGPPSSAAEPSPPSPVANSNWYGYTEPLQPTSSGKSTRGSDDSISLSIPVEEQSYLLEAYLDNIHEGIPIFINSHFLSDCRNLVYSHDLILTIVVITAKLTGYVFTTATFDIDSCIDEILSAGSLEEEMFGNSPSIDQFRKSCLLAFYEFHQFPGRQAWMRIGKLTRMAMWTGLDRLEIIKSKYPSWRTMTERQLEEWRLIWWCIYRLDSYANLSSGTPYLIDETLAYTSLLQEVPGRAPIEDQHDSVHENFLLSSHHNSLWGAISIISSQSREISSFNFHIITTTLLRAAVRAIRVHSLQQQPEVRCLDDIERHLSAVRLSLPTNYLNTRRNAFSNETGPDHHARLVTLFHLNLVQFLLSVINCYRREQDDEWILRWQRVYEACQDLASISEQWNSSHNLRVDPAISMIIFAALIFLDVHKKSASALVWGSHSSIEHSERVLMMQLEQLATIWTLPRLLTLSLKSFRESVSGPLSFSHIQYILSHFEAPLHPRWLHFLSTTQPGLNECQ
ncbi:hypothetical protein CI102_12213 [Trichoderma harzianum]|nr:hypothetical protein CI102_12213 [Trichoderma harzianum]